MTNLVVSSISGGEFGGASCLTLLQSEFGSPANPGPVVCRARDIEKETGILDPEEGQGQMAMEEPELNQAVPRGGVHEPKDRREQLP